MRIGLFGGSFNPIHNGHIMIAQKVRAEFGLDTVLLMVAGDPPHKELAQQVTGSQRLEMANIASRGLEGIIPCDWELKRTGKSYTSDTLLELGREYPGAQLFTIVGADMLMSLSTWHEPQTLFANSVFIGVARGGLDADVYAQAEKLKNEFGANILLSELTGPELSSTMVREAIFNARPAGDMISGNVEQYIYENALYVDEDFEDTTLKLKTTLKGSRFSHSVGTLREALRLSERFGEDAKAARLAALLHDCAKVPAKIQLELIDKFVQQGVITQARAEELRAMKPALLHGPLGALVAAQDYGVENSEVLLAIACHTVGREGMTRLDKLTYLADKIEPTRDYMGVEALREAAERGLDAGVLACMDSAVLHVLKKGEALDKTVLDARQYITKQNKIKGGEKLNEKSREQVLSVCKVLYDKKAADIMAVYVADKTIVAEWFVICSGHSTTQVKTLCDELEDKYAELGLELRRKEGYSEGRWIVLDFADILVHIFYPEEREYYNMERLWLDDPRNCINYSAEHPE